MDFMKLILIRHAETDMAGTFCGHSDPPVNATGYQQIESLLYDLRSEPIEAVFTSDLQRALTTAKALAEFHAIPYVTDSNFREIYFGEWEGRTWQQIEKQDSAFARRWTDLYPNLSAPKGEAFAFFRQRILAAINSLLNRTEFETAAIVTHAGVMRVVLQSMCGFEHLRTGELTKSYCCHFHLPCTVIQ